MHAIRCCKQGCERADLAKSSKERVKGVLYSPSKKLVFMPVASAMSGGHRDCPVLASIAQWLEIQPPVSRGQLVSADLP